MREVMRWRRLLLVVWCLGGLAACAAEPDAGAAQVAVDDDAGGDPRADAGGQQDAEAPDGEEPRDTGNPGDPDVDGVGDAGVPDAQGPDVDDPPPLETCRFTASDQGEQVVDTWRGDVPRVVFEVPGVPEPAGVIRATLRYAAYDADHPDGEGWIEVNGTERIALPADEALDNQSRDFVVEVTGRLVAGTNRIGFAAFEGPEGAFFRISGVSLELTGAGLGCDAPGPVEVIDHPAPAGVSAFAALSPDFPRRGLMEILAGLSRPLTTVLLDFEPVTREVGRQMFLDGPVGRRQPNPAHFAALTDFIRAYVDATPGADERHLQLYLLNGPGVRRAGYPRAYPDLGPEALDAAVQGDAGVRAELAAYLGALNQAVAPHRGTVAVRLAVGLEDNFTLAGARAVRSLAIDAGWPAEALGRNPCGCGFGDTERQRGFYEIHPHSLDELRAARGGLEPGDSFSNDGWGFTDAQGAVQDSDVVAMARIASGSGLWFHLWYDALQGYPVPDDGPRRLRFDLAPSHLLALLARGLTDPENPGPTGTGQGVERTINYRNAAYTQRRNWVLDCRDYAYTARFDEHRACDNRYNPDGTGHGTATFTFEGVIPDLYDVLVEGRHTENRNPAGMVVTVNGVEGRIDQRGDGSYVYARQGTYELSGTVTVIIDSTRATGSDSVRNVRLAPVR